MSACLGGWWDGILFVSSFRYCRELLRLIDRFIEFSWNCLASIWMEVSETTAAQRKESEGVSKKFSFPKTKACGCGSLGHPRKKFTARAGAAGVREKFSQPGR